MTSQDGYQPRFSDSARAGAALPDDFLRTFKQSLLADYKGFVGSMDFVPFALPNSSRSAASTPARHVQPSRQLLDVNHDVDSDNELHYEPTSTPKTVPGIASMGVSDLNYPLSLFDGLPELPLASIIEDLTRTFEIGFLKKAPFLSSLSNMDSPILAGLTGRSPVPPYLAFSRALIGTLVCERLDYRIWAQNLYETALKLFVGSVELDNRTSRNMHWYEAGILLVIYGTLHSDLALWETTTMVNGYFLAPYKRRGFLKIVDSHATFDYQDMSLLTSFYFLVDILRAIHLNTPPSFNQTDLSFPLTTTSSGRFEDIYRQIIVNRQSLAPCLAPDEYLLALLCILSETVQLLRFLGPFADETIQSNRTEDMPPMHLIKGPYLPSSATYEYLQQSEALIQSLDVWHSSVINNNSADFSGAEHFDAASHGDFNANTLRVHKNVLPLAYFCRILLEIGSRALELPNIAGYDGLPLRGQSPHSPSDKQPHRLGIHISDTAIECAWKVLDALDDDERNSNYTESTNNDSFIPLWLPLVVFYAGLAVWARMQEDQDRGVLKGAQNSVPARRRLLRSFQNELKRMEKQYKSASRMADVIKNLCP